MSKTSTRVRSAINGRFVPNRQAVKHPKTTIRERIKVGPVKKRK